MTIEAIAPGKMILVGEYAVLEGAPALVSAVNREARVCLDTYPGTGLCVDAPQVQLHNFSCRLEEGALVADPGRELPESLKVVSTVLEHFATEIEPRIQDHCLSITIDTSGFVQSENGFKLGLGSSAAVTVALMRAVMAFLGKEGADILPQALFERAHGLHQKMQGGVGSGLDIAASVFGGLVAFPNRELHQALIPEKLDALSWPAMASVFVGASASTTDLVMKVNTLRTKSRETFEDFMEQMREAATHVIVASREGDLSGVREGCSAYCRLMERLGQASGADIISEPHRRLRDLSIENGFDYKPSGAGGGDLGIILAKDEAELSDFRSEVEALGCSWTELGISSQGVRLAS